MKIMEFINGKKILFMACIMSLCIAISGCGNTQDETTTKSETESMSKFNVEEYNKALDAYLSYGENLGKNYSNATMTLTMDGNNKPIFLAFLGEMENAMLEISSYIDGSVKTLDTIKANHVWKLDNGIIVAQYFDESEENAKYRIVQVKDDELRLLMKGKGVWGKTCRDSEINLYFGNENKKTTIQGTYARDDWYYYPVAKDYEDEIREWFTYVYGNDERYLDWMSNFEVDMIFCEGDTIVDDIPLICSSYTLFESYGVWEVGSYESGITLRSMVNDLKKETCNTWKDFLIYDTNRLYELFGYELGYANTVFPHIDASWISELDYIKDFKVLTTEESWGEEIIDYGYIHCDAGVLDGSALYGLLFGMNPVIGNDSECSESEGEFIIRPMQSVVHIMDNDEEISSYELSSMYLEINETLLNQWLISYLDIDSIEDAVDMKIDNSALVKSYYEWISSKDYEEKFQTELQRKEQEKKELEEKKENINKISEMYNKYMEDEGYNVSDYKFFAANIDDDDIPELICCDKKNEGWNSSVLTIQNGEIIEYKQFYTFWFLNNGDLDNRYSSSDRKIMIDGVGDRSDRRILIIEARDGKTVVDIYDFRENMVFRSYKNSYTDGIEFKEDLLEEAFDDSKAETIDWQYDIYGALMSTIGI